jgi:UDP-4-amino-4-deoxy-L-arabinose-oxoglutarate aminotransferase
LLLPQLEGIEQRLARREQIARRYESAIADLHGLRVQRIPPDTRPARHLFTVLAPPGQRDDYLEGLQNLGVGVAVNYRCITELTWYRDNHDRWHAADGLIHARDIGDRTLTLPLYPGLTDDEVEHVIDALARVHDRRSAKTGVWVPALAGRLHFDAEPSF